MRRRKKRDTAAHGSWFAVTASSTPRLRCLSLLRFLRNKAFGTYLFSPKVPPLGTGSAPCARGFAHQTTLRQPASCPRTDLRPHYLHHFLCADRVLVVFPQCPCPDCQGPLQLRQSLVVSALRKRFEAWGRSRNSIHYTAACCHRSSILFLAS